jgi:NADH:ubiquinone oxidoreductase subunit 4 (subunit M)
VTVGFESPGCPSLVFFPLVAAVLIALLPKSATSARSRLWATLAAAVELVVSLPLWWRVVPGRAPGSSSRSRWRGSPRSAPAITSASMA